MDVFISWSGDQSHKVAKALKEWLPKVLNGIEPWVSSDDMEKGSLWTAELANRLENAGAGIICLTPTNLHSDWVLFEAGALSRTLRNKLVCPLLVGVESSALKSPSGGQSPLGHLQHTRAEKDDVLRLLTTLNAAMGSNALPPDRLRRAFTDSWPKLKSRLSKLSQESLQLANFQVDARALAAEEDFKVAKKSVREAKESIIVVANFTLPQRPNPSRKVQSARSSYYSSLEKKVIASSQIDYKRIVQLPCQDADTIQHAETMKYNRPFVSHLRKCIQARARKSNPATNIGVFWCAESQQLTSFLVIDRAIVFIEFYALVVLPDGNKCSQYDRGLMIRDHTGEIPRVFERIFNDLLSHSHPLKPADVTKFEKSLTDLDPGEAWGIPSVS